MGGKGSGSLSQTYLVKKAKEVLQKSETYLLKVLDGKTKLPERTVAQIALELYKRRIPSVTEGSSGSNHLTVVKVIKNHLPGKAEEEAIDILPNEVAEEVQEAMKDVVIEPAIKRKKIIKVTAATQNKP